MKRGYALLMLVLLLHGSFLFLDDLKQSYTLGDMEENITLESSFSGDDLPEDTFIKGSVLPFTTILLLSNLFFYTSIQIIKRLLFLYPVFYQSIYVVHSPLN